MGAITQRIFAFGLVSACATCLAGPDKESFGPAQAAADILRKVTKADIAFLPAGVLKPSYKAGPLTEMLQFPTDEVTVVEITGAQVRAGLERSVSLLPSPNPGFLQIAGLTVTFSPTAKPNARIREVRVAGAALKPEATYRVAMPGSLARGGLGYFTVWKRDRIVETLEDATLETVLKGKTSTDPTPRWRAVP